MLRYYLAGGLVSAAVLAGGVMEYYRRNPSTTNTGTQANLNPELPSDVEAVQPSHDDLPQVEPRTQKKTKAQLEAEFAAFRQKPAAPENLTVAASAVDKSNKSPVSPGTANSPEKDLVKAATVEQPAEPAPTHEGVAPRNDAIKITASPLAQSPELAKSAATSPTAPPATTAEKESTDSDSPDNESTDSDSPDNSTKNEVVANKNNANLDNNKSREPAPSQPTLAADVTPEQERFTVLRPLPPDRVELRFPGTAMEWTAYQIGTNYSGLNTPAGPPNNPGVLGANANNQNPLNNNPAATPPGPLNRNVNPNGISLDAAGPVNRGAGTTGPLNNLRDANNGLVRDNPATATFSQSNGVVSDNPQLAADANNTESIKAASRDSDTLLRGAQLAFQQATFPEDQALSGKLVAIEDLLRVAGDRERRIKLLKGYWTLAAAMAEYHWATEEFYQLRHAADLAQKNAGLTGMDPTQQQYMAAAINAALARRLETKASAISAQHELAVLMGMGNGPGELPLAVDVPLVGTYRTRIDEIFSDRRPPARLQSIASTIDLKRDTINFRAFAIKMNWNAFDQILKEYQDRKGDAQFVVLAYEQLVKQRRAFLAAVRDYNGDITDYTMNVIDTRITPEDLAQRLVRTPNRAQLRAASNAAAGLDRVNYSARQPTLADDWSGGESAPAENPVQRTTFVEGSGNGANLKSVLKQK
ncbi:MAG: hypothetical protein SFX18_07630 [Pirellulales bacterium]|nr:hypothetical protein [Pirellulales bacterium]